MFFSKTVLEAIISVTGRASDADGVEGVDVRPAWRMGALRSGKYGRFSIARRT